MECAIELAHNRQSAGNLDLFQKFLGGQQQKILLLVGFFIRSPFLTGFNKQDFMLGHVWYESSCWYLIQ